MYLSALAKRKLSAQITEPGSLTQGLWTGTRKISELYEIAKFFT